MVKLEVRLHSAAAAFFTGEQVNGEVIARVQSPTEAHRICVHVFGHALNGWEGGDDRTYRAEVQFINVLLVLWQSSDGKVGVIEPGNYCFPFSFVVPPNALPNRRSLFACVDYWCKAKVDRPQRIDNEVTFPFVVSNIVDLNAIPHAPNPVRWSLGAQVGCCGGNGVLSAEASIDKFGYVGGEDMQLRVDVNNATSGTVRTIHVRVTEEWVYKAFPFPLSRSYWDPVAVPSSRFSARDLLSFKDAVNIPPHDSDCYERRIKLPPLQPSYATAIIVHNFYIQVFVSTGGICSSSACGRVTFCVGTMPLSGAQAVSASGKITVDTKEESDS